LVPYGAKYFLRRDKSSYFLHIPSTCSEGISNKIDIDINSQGISKEHDLYYTLSMFLILLFVLVCFPKSVSLYIYVHIHVICHISTMMPHTHHASSVGSPVASSLAVRAPPWRPPTSSTSACAAWARTAPCRTLGWTR
jgi:hypothetical protein